MPDLADRLRAHFATVHALALATTDKAGAPFAANVNFAVDAQLRPFFVSAPGTAHARNIAQRPHVAVTAYAPYDRADQIRGVQLRGTCAPLAASQFERNAPHRRQIRIGV